MEAMNDEQDGAAAVEGTAVRAGVVAEVFAFWQQCNNYARARLDDKRVRLIRRALRWKYTAGDLKLAILGNARSPWHNGANDRGGVYYTDLGLVLRDADHIDRFMKMGEQECLRAFHEATKEHTRRTEVEAGRREIPPEARARIERLLRVV